MCAAFSSVTFTFTLKLEDMIATFAQPRSKPLADSEESWVCQLKVTIDSFSF